MVLMLRTNKFLVFLLSFLFILISDVSAQKKAANHLRLPLPQQLILNPTLNQFCGATWAIHVVDDQLLLQA